MSLTSSPVGRLPQKRVEPLTSLTLRFDLVFSDVMNENFVGRPWLMEMASFTPVIATGIGKHVALSIETGTWDWALDGIKAFQTLLRINHKRIELRAG